MGSLSIIHLSDIHIKNSDDTILKRYEEISKACVSCVKDKSTLVIVVSGDIAYSGECEQYKLATKFFENIKQYIENEKNIKVEVVISPGNHDCDFSENSSVRDILINNINPTDIDQEYVNNVIAKQKHFYDFVLQYYDDMNNRICWEKEISIDNNDVLFVSVNSAWMSELHEQPGKLVIPQSFLPVIDLNDYEAVIYVCHHPLNWLNPDYKTPFIDHLRNNADIVLFGHEHYKDNYIQTGKTYELINYHGKELQNSKSSESGFSIIAFDDDFKSYNVKDYEWVENRIYNRINDNDRVFERNKAIRSVYSVNESLLDYIDDIGINVKHFAKENIVLSDLFIWPDLIKSDYKNEKSGSVRISDNYFKELCENKLSIIVGESTSGKTTLSKQLFRSELNAGRCCILVYGQNFTTSTENAIIKTIEETYKKQYSGDYLEEFRQLPRKNKTLIIDNFDSIQNNNNRRSKVIDCVSNQFDTVVILMASSFAITTLLKSEVINSSDELYYYEIKPFGNKKRKDFISKWYKLNNVSDTEKTIDEKIEQAKGIVNNFLGNGASFIPAYPIILTGILQNKDAFSQSIHVSKYGYLYESLINQSLASIAEYETNSGLYNLDTEILSGVAYEILHRKRTAITKEDIGSYSKKLCEEKILSNVHVEQFIDRMQRAKVLIEEFSNGDGYKFKYPYFFYYFAAKYIANHLNDEQVQNLMEHMSSTLLFCEIKDAVKHFIPQKISSNENVESNKDAELKQMDKMGMNDGEVSKGEDYIDDTISEEDKNFAEIVAALKTIEVLGQILQNYPADISGQNKIKIIDEMHRLGMRSVNAIIETMKYLKDDLINFVYESSVKNKSNISREEIENRIRTLINVIVVGMARSMIHQVARSLSSELLLPAVEKTYENDDSISTQLLMTDLKLNCLKDKVNYDEIKQLRDKLDKGNELFAKGIVDSIVGRYLNYNECDFKLRSKFCNLCGFAERPMFASVSENLINS